MKSISIFLVYLCVASISCEWLPKTPSLEQVKNLDNEKGLQQQPIKNVKATTQTTQPEKQEILSKLALQTSDQDLLKQIADFIDAKNTTNTQHREKRQLAWAGGMGHGFGAYDYNDYYGDYISDYAYDYYDWVCTESSCQLCDILTSECCNPANDVNCFLPDSCINNPCLSGGTCITTQSIDHRPDFICVCLPGLTGKYCQLFNDYFVGTDIVHPIYPPMLPPPIPPPMPISVMDYDRPIFPQSFPPPPPPQAGHQQSQGNQGAQAQSAYPAYPAPAPAYPAPAPAYPAPAPAYQAPAPVAYPAPAPAYHAPATQAYHAPAPVYQAPAPAYQAPVQQYSTAAPAAAYGQQIRTLGAKAIPCEGKKIYSASEGRCVAFALKKV